MAWNKLHALTWTDVYIFPWCYMTSLSHIELIYNQNHSRNAHQSSYAEETSRGDICSLPDRISPHSLMIYNSHSWHFWKKKFLSERLYRLYQHPGTRLRRVPGFRDPGSILTLGQVTQYGNPYLICIIAQFPKKCFDTHLMEICVRGSWRIAAESRDMWSGALHTTLYYYNYLYFCTQ